MAHDELQEKLDLAAKALEGALSLRATEMVAIRTAILHLIDAVQEVHKRLDISRGPTRV